MGKKNRSGLYFVEWRLKMGGWGIFHSVFPLDRQDSGLQSSPIVTARSNTFRFRGELRHTRIYMCVCV